MTFSSSFKRSRLQIENKWLDFDYSDFIKFFQWFSIFNGKKRDILCVYWAEEKKKNPKALAVWESSLWFKFNISSVLKCVEIYYDLNEKSKQKSYW